MSALRDAQFTAQGLQHVANVVYDKVMLVQILRRIVECICCCAVCRRVGRYARCRAGQGKGPYAVASTAHQHLR